MLLGDSGSALSAADLEVVAECTTGYSGSDMTDLVTEALLRPVRELSSSEHWKTVEAGGGGGGGERLCPCSPHHPGAVSRRLADIHPTQVEKVWRRGGGVREEGVWKKGSDGGKSGGALSGME